MTPKRSGRLSKDAPNLEMQRWISNGLNGIDMFGEGAHLSGEATTSRQQTEEGPLPDHRVDGESPGEAPKPVELQVISNKLVECSLTFDIRGVQVRGPVKDTFSARASEIAVVLKDLIGAILGIPLNAINAVNMLDVKRLPDKVFAASGVSLTLPGEYREVISGRKFQVSMEAFIQLLDDDQRSSSVCEALLMESGVPELISTAAVKLRNSLGGVDLRDGLVLASEAWTQQRQLPRVIAAAEEPEKKAIPEHAHGAFRGFFIDEREAFFVEQSGRRAKLVLNFEEQKFLKIVRLLSQADFITCRIEYLRHCIGGKTEHLRLTKVSEVQTDLYRGGEQFSLEVGQLLAEINAPSA